MLAVCVDLHVFLNYCFFIYLLIDLKVLRYYSPAVIKDIFFVWRSSLNCAWEWCKKYVWQMLCVFIYDKLMVKVLIY